GVPPARPGAAGGRGTRGDNAADAGDACRRPGSLQKDVENTFNIKLLSVPLALREMNWLEFLGTRRSGGDLAAGDGEITKLASEVMDTPLKTVRKGQKVKQAVEAIEEETGTPVLPAGKRSRQEDAAGGALEPHPETLRQKRRTVTPAALLGCGAPAGWCSCSAATRAPASLPSIFKTPGLRAPAAQERVFSISANGSPLADGNEIFLTLPMGGGEVRQRGAAGRGWGRASSEQELVGGGWGQSLAGPRGHGAPQTSSGWVWVA
uniref:Borealin n=1 Tax=Varanus komodoensis TaxID=61221 RepID=A0A8D2LDE9_VARKO